MVLSRGDDFPLHQTPEPVASPGPDRNFYDRYFFNGYAPDGSGFFAVAFGVYPALDVVDAHFCAIRGNIQHCLHASRRMGDERLDLTCGPIRIEILEPLQSLRIVVEGEGLSADLTFTGRAFPIEEPRFSWQVGGHTVMDYTRLTQNGHYQGWIEVDGEKTTLTAGTCGTRDRSWGIRPVGTRDPDRTGISQFFWQWTPVNFPDRSAFFHLNAHQDGTAWNTRGVIVADGADATRHVDVETALLDTALAPGSRWPAKATLMLGDEALTFTPVGRFQMRGLGYTSPTWGHGIDHGILAVEREDIDLSTIDPARPDNLHVQMICRVTSASGEEGTGTFEQLAIGPYGLLGLTGLTDPA
ncbi:MAG: hypothetical protein ACK4NZ_02125 [Tsuneonella sp.]